jgi:hypothetical protein
MSLIRDSINIISKGVKGRGGVSMMNEMRIGGITVVVVVYA